MMILSILATVVLLGALFYHRVSLFISSVILLAWTAALGAAGVWNIWLGTAAAGDHPRAI